MSIISDDGNGGEDNGSYVGLEMLESNNHDL